MTEKHDWESIAKKLYTSCLNAQGAYDIMRGVALHKRLPGFGNVEKSLKEAIAEFDAFDRQMRYKEMAELEDGEDLWDTGNVSETDQVILDESGFSSGAGVGDYESPLDKPEEQPCYHCYDILKCGICNPKGK
jgi:hypothetical protein